MDVWVTKKLKLFLPIIEPNITDKTIFIEPFCGSCVVSYAIYKKHDFIKFNVNDIDKIRTDFYINMRDEEKTKELYKLEESIVKIGIENIMKLLKKIILNLL